MAYYKLSHYFDQHGSLLVPNPARVDQWVISTIIKFGYIRGPQNPLILTVDIFDHKPNGTSKYGVVKNQSRLLCEKSTFRLSRPPWDASIPIGSMYGIIICLHLP